MDQALMLRMLGVRPTVDLAKLQQGAMSQEDIERRFAERQAGNRQEMGLPDGGWSAQERPKTQEELELWSAQNQIRNRQRMNLPMGGWDEEVKRLLAARQQGQDPTMGRRVAPPQFQGAPSMQEVQNAAYAPPQPPMHPLQRGAGDQRQVDLRALIEGLRR